MKYNKLYTKEASVFLRSLPDNVIDLTVTSPPYDKLRNYHSDFDLETIIKELYRATKPGGVCVWVVADQTRNYCESGTSFRQALSFMENGWNLFDTMIWEKSNYMPGAPHRYADAFEYMFVFSKGKPKTFNPIKIPCVTAGQNQTWSMRPHESKVWKKKGVKEVRSTLPEKIKGNIWTYSTGKGGSTNDTIAFSHPAIFPEKLVRDHIHTWTNIGDLVCDFFVGSGTTMKVAYAMNRSYLGCDINPDYINICKKRINNYKEKYPLFNQKSII